MTDRPNATFAEIEDHLSGGDALEGVIVRELDMNQFAHLDEISAINVQFQSCLFSETKLVASSFEHCQFYDCRFAGADLRETRFEHCSFFSAKSGAGADFRYAQMREARFDNCNLSGSRFIGANLFDIVIKDCKANGAVFREAEFAHGYGQSTPVVRASIINSILNDADFSDLNLEGATLERSSFVNADLSGSIFLGADMTGCDLSHAQLSRTNFDQTDLRRARLEGMSLASLSGYDRMKISADQQAEILTHLGVLVFD